VIVDRKQFANLEFFAQGFQHPGVTLSSAPLAYKRISTIGLPGDTLTIDELQFEIIVDENMTSYIEMYNWVELLTEGRSNTTTDIVPLNKVSHEADISVLLMTNSNKVVKTIKYIDCVPTSIGSLSFSSSSSEAAQVNFNASFRAEYFVIT
jgi:hypothetical protein